MARLKEQFPPQIGTSPIVYSFIGKEIFSYYGAFNVKVFTLTSGTLAQPLFFTVGFHRIGIGSHYFPL